MHYSVSGRDMVGVGAKWPLPTAYVKTRCSPDCSRARKDVGHHLRQRAIVATIGKAVR